MDDAEKWDYRGNNVVAVTCRRCGALVDVSNKPLHNKWHLQLERGSS